MKIYGLKKKKMFCYYNFLSRKIKIEYNKANNSHKDLTVNF